jgi:hypothetical protein
MSKKQDNAAALSGSLTESQEELNQSGSDGNKPSENPTIEEHAIKLNVSESVFMAVMQSKKWASGIRLPEADFKKAVDEFSGTPPKNLTIEEHAKNLHIDAPVFAAVMQSKKWAGGKRVPEAAFKKAIADFNGAPMGGM